MKFLNNLSTLINKLFNFPEKLYSVQNKYLLVATFFGLGYARKAPGTVASFVAMIIAIILGSFNTKLVLFLFVVVLIVGLFVAEKEYTSQSADPSHIVIDEVAGQLLAVLLVCNNVWLSLLAFAIFRVLDIKKPWLISKSEKYFKGGMAIMIDDILAGFVALFITATISLFLQ